MKQDRISGTAIIAGSLMAVATMALHPVGGRLDTDLEHLERVAPVAFGVHVLALFAIGLLIFGFLGLRRGLGSESARVRAGLVAHLIGWTAVFGAALTSGLLTREMIQRYPGLDDAERSAMHVLWDYNFMINQALDKVWVVGTCLGTILWSAVMWGHDRWWKAAGVLGVVVGAVGLTVLAAGRFRMNIAGVGLFVGAFSLWTVYVGALLFRRSSPPR